MKNKKIICCLLVLITLFILPLNASAFDYEENDVVIDFIPGDINDDGRVNTKDARICMRVAANLETLTPEQIKAVDFDGSGEIGSANARKILRASAKLETITYTINVEAGQRIVLPALERVGAYDWVYKTDSAETKINRTAGVEISGDTGYFRQYFTITTNEKNSFTVAFEQSCPWTGEIRECFNLNVVMD